MRKKLPRYLRILFAAFSFCISLLSFTFLGKYLASWPALQLGPNLAKFFSAFGIGAALILFALFFLTFVFGRFYCAVLCPFGILQDLIRFFIPKKIEKKNERVGNYPKARYLIAIFVFGAMIGGYSLIFGLLDPWSNFGRMASSLFNPLFIGIYNQIFPFDGLFQPITDSLWILFGALTPFFILLFLLIWKRRIFCTAICPVGTLLGLLGKGGLFTLGINSEKCVRCKRCVKKCPAGCIEIGSEKILDFERCLLCMDCMALCPEGAIEYGFSKKNLLKESETDSSRRKFLALGGLFALGGLGTGLYASDFRQSLKEGESPDLICPPGAGSPERFLSRCTDCNLCIPVCEGHVLKPAGIKSKVVHLSFEEGVCEFNCKRCTEVCPTGALFPMKLREKQRLRIAMAEVKLPICVVITEGTDCGACSEVCPTGALVMEEEASGRRIPVLYPDFCIGCGSCEHACPVRPERAVLVHAIPLQVEAEDPKKRLGREVLEDKSGERVIRTDEWLF